MNLTLLAIDPGQSGGIAVLRHDGITDAVAMPDTPKDICDWISAQQAEAISNGNQVKCFIERVGGYVGGGGQPGSAMFTFGFNTGILHGFLVALGIPFEQVVPSRWQKEQHIGCAGLQKGSYEGLSDADRKRESKRVSELNGRLKTAWKNKLKAHAQNLNPHLRVTLKTADALLILEYARRVERVNLAPSQQPFLKPIAPSLWPEGKEVLQSGGGSCS